jgi:hypothetical protein
MAGFGRREYKADSFRDAARGSEELTGGVLLLMEEIILSGLMIVRRGQVLRAPGSGLEILLLLHERPAPAINLENPD